MCSRGLIRSDSTVTIDMTEMSLTWMKNHQMKRPVCFGCHNRVEKMLRAKLFERYLFLINKTCTLTGAFDSGSSISTDCAVVCNHVKSTNSNIKLNRKKKINWLLAIEQEMATVWWRTVCTQRPATKPTSSRRCSEDAHDRRALYHSDPNGKSEVFYRLVQTNCHWVQLRLQHKTTYRTLTLCCQLNVDISWMDCHFQRQSVLSTITSLVALSRFSFSSGFMHWATRHL